MDTTRIDKWCWAARFFKTRSQATEAVERGRIKLNGERTKPAHNVRNGDRLDIDNGSTEWEVLVTGIADGALGRHCRHPVSGNRGEHHAPCRAGRTPSTLPRTFCRDQGTPDQA
jgi:ribosomal 50S subunit-recycling heat shock protein